MRYPPRSRNPPERWPKSLEAPAQQAHPESLGTEKIPGQIHCQKLSFLTLRGHAGGGVGGAVLLVFANALDEFEEEAPVERIGVGVREFPVVVLIV